MVQSFEKQYNISCVKGLLFNVANKLLIQYTVTRLKSQYEDNTLEDTSLF